MPAPSITGTQIYNGLFGGSWAGGASLVLTYSVPATLVVGANWTSNGYAQGSAGLDSDEPWTGFDLLNPGQTSAFNTIMEMYDSYVAATFDPTSDPGNIRVAFTAIAEAGTWGYAYLPDANTSTVGDELSGDIWIDEDQENQSFAVGTYNFIALAHEVGHALGLKHSFEDGAVIPAQFDNYRYTIMSYTSQIDQYRVVFTETPTSYSVNFKSVNPVTPMLFDIYTMQQIYGADTTTRATNSTYTFNPNSASLMTIWDAGGIDVWNLTGHSRPSTIDLRAGSFSSIDYFSKAAQIEAAVLQIGEGARSFISSNVNSADTFTWTNNVAIAYNCTIENVYCGEASDSVIGNSANNDLRGNGGNDTLNGLAGNDSLNGGAGSDTASYSGASSGVVVKLAITSAQAVGGGMGSDTLTSIENLSGSIYADNLTGNGVANSLSGGDGNDTLNGGVGNDRLNGGNSTDTASYAGATSGVTVSLAVATAQAVGGGYGSDTLTLIENLAGSSFGDALTGNSANNVLNGGAGNDILNGGTGTDTASYSGATSAVSVNLAVTVAQAVGGGMGSDTLASIECVAGSAYNDVLRGNSIANVLSGGAGNDFLYGGLGNDTLGGGAGADNFVFNTAPNASTNLDRITDYTVVDDTIRLENAVFTALTATGTLSASLLDVNTTNSSVAGEADDRIIYNKVTGTLFYDSNGNAAGGSVQIATLSANLALTNADFLII